MHAQVSVEVAQANLKELISKLAPGEEIVITDKEQPVAKLIAAPVMPQKPRQPGTLKGTVLYIAPDFDAPLELRECKE
jgi:antitoxin (DNA-binding transcriptional repressor) of toxin-antitoxin stability system